MKTVQFKNEKGETVKFLRIQSFKNDDDRRFILQIFANNPAIRCVETNVRRYTADEIYAGRTGQMI